MRTSRTIRLLSDAALEQFDPNHADFDPNDAPRCGPLAEQLSRQLLDFVIQKEKHRHDCRVASFGRGFYPAVQKKSNLSIPRIGVLGGLGQGKTSTIRWALYKTEQKLQKQLNWRLNDKVEFFDTAHYKNDDLEFELDRLLGGLGPGSSWLFRILLIGFLGGVIYVLSLPDLKIDSKFVENLIKGLGLLASLGIFGVLIQPLIKPWVYWWRSGLRDMTFGSWAWCCKGVKLLLRRVEVLVIDNLDRASLDQQRAVLRAFYKHRDELAYAVIIGFDESRLLNSKPDPEAPIDLLRKAINVEARMPVRTPSDTVRLAWMAMSQAAGLNSHWRELLTDFRAIAALARILELLTPLQAVSPRVAKHLVNNALFFLAQVREQTVHFEDWRAVLRLLALYSALPELRNQGADLRKVLQANEYNGLNALLPMILADVENRKAEDVSVVLAQRIFNHTRAYFPADYDWSPWIVAWKSRAVDDYLSAMNDMPLQLRPIPDFDQLNLLFDGLLRLACGQPRTELTNLTDLLPGFAEAANNTESLAPAFLAVVDVLALSLDAQERRNRLFMELWRAVDENGLPWLFPNLSKSKFYRYMAELILQEAKPLVADKQELFTAWWLRLAAAELNISFAQRQRLLCLLPVSRFYLAELLAYAALCQDEGLGPENWLAGYGYCLPGKRLYLPDKPLPVLLNTDKLPIDIINRMWPPLDVAKPGFLALLAEHCAAWLHFQPAGGICLSALEFLIIKDEGFGDLLQKNTATLVLPALAKIFSPDDGKSWTPSVWRVLLAHQLLVPLDEQKQKQVWLDFIALRKRLAPLWQNPINDPYLLQIQCLLAATFPKKRAVNTLLKKLPIELRAETAAMIADNISLWADAASKIVWRPKNGYFHNFQTQSEYTELLKQAWLSRLGITRSGDDYAIH